MSKLYVDTVGKSSDVLYYIHDGTYVNEFCSIIDAYYAGKYVLYLNARCCIYVGDMLRHETFTPYLFYILQIQFYDKFIVDHVSNPFIFLSNNKLPNSSTMLYEFDYADKKFYNLDIKVPDIFLEELQNITFNHIDNLLNLDPAYGYIANNKYQAFKYIGVYNPAIIKSNSGE